MWHEKTIIFICTTDGGTGTGQCGSIGHSAFVPESVDVCRIIYSACADTAGFLSFDVDEQEHQQVLSDDGKTAFSVYQ